MVTQDSLVLFSKMGSLFFFLSYYLAKVNKQLFLWQGLSSGNAFSIFTTLSCQVYSVHALLWAAAFTCSVYASRPQCTCTAPHSCSRYVFLWKGILLVHWLPRCLPLTAAFFLSFFFHLHPFFSPSLLQLFVFSFLWRLSDVTESPTRYISLLSASASIW